MFSFVMGLSVIFSGEIIWWPRNSSKETFK